MKRQTSVSVWLTRSPTSLLSLPGELWGSADPTVPSAEQDPVNLTSSLHPYYPAKLRKGPTHLMACWWLFVEVTPQEEDLSKMPLFSGALSIVELTFTLLADSVLQNSGGENMTYMLISDKQGKGRGKENNCMNYLLARGTW